MWRVINDLSIKYFKTEVRNSFEIYFFFDRKSCMDGEKKIITKKKHERDEILPPKSCIHITLLIIENPLTMALNIALI